MANGTASRPNGRINGSAPALIKHLLAMLVAGIGGVFALGLVYGDVLATGKKADENRTAIEAIEDSIHEMAAEQKVMIQRLDDEQENSRTFRERTGNALDRILLRLPRRERPVR